MYEAGRSQAVLRGPLVSDAASEEIYVIQNNGQSDLTAAQLKVALSEVLQNFLDALKPIIKKFLLGMMYSEMAASL
ncbi:Protein of unknown function [Gryllus bimaculatus]|nr:Protein of unknown function [Gryllus bimaculatus]